MNRNAGTTRLTSRRRSGFILIVVVIVIVLLSLAAYNYSGTMQVEYEATVMSGRDVAARMAAESGIEFAAARILDLDYDDTIDIHHDPTTFRGQIIMDSEADRGRLKFSIVVPDETNVTSGNIRFGLASENAKFNLNKLLEIDENDIGEDGESTGLCYFVMSSIPNMTDDVVDAILDWIDSDDDRRPGGAETADYMSRTIPYEARNGPMESIDELLQIQGVTPALFYGEDANRNGLLDPNEDDGGESDELPPYDNGDGILDLGWQHYLTATSRERNTTPEGEDKINLNQGLMTELFDALESEFGTDAASFVIAYRLAGTEYAKDPIPPQELEIQDDISRNGIDLTKVPLYQFSSIYELIGGETNPVAMLDGTTQTFISPWTDDASSLLAEFPELERMLTVNDDAYVEGRININQAREQVLFMVPYMPETVPGGIIAARPPVDVTGASANVMARRHTAAWLLAEGLVDLETLRFLGPYITTGGDVYRFQAVGHYDQGGPTTRMEAVIDATEYPPRIRSVRDLTSLGRGYHPSLLTDQNTVR